MKKAQKSIRIVAAPAIKAGQVVFITPIAHGQIPRKITCYPVPGQGVINYEPDWFGLTHFG